MRSHETSRQRPAAPGPGQVRRSRTALQTQAGNRAVASLLQPRRVQRAPDDDPSATLEQAEQRLALARTEVGLFNTGWDVAAGVQDFVHQVPGVGDVVPEAGPNPYDPMATIEQTQRQLALARTEAGVIDTARDVGAGVQNVVHELPGMGEAVPHAGPEPIVTPPTVYERPAPIVTPPTVYEHPAPIVTPPTVYERP